MDIGGHQIGPFIVLVIHPTNELLIWSELAIKFGIPQFNEVKAFKMLFFKDVLYVVWMMQNGKAAACVNGIYQSKNPLPVYGRVQKSGNPNSTYMNDFALVDDFILDAWHKKNIPAVFYTIITKSIEFCLIEP